MQSPLRKSGVIVSPSIMRKPLMQRILSMETLMGLIIVASGLVALWQMFDPQRSIIALALAGVTLTLSAIALVRLLVDPDSIRARQTDDMLKLARQTFACMQEGLGEKSAQKLCEMLLPNTAAIAVAITNNTVIEGYAGVTEQPEDPVGMNIATKATMNAVQDGRMRILMTPEEIGWPFAPKYIKAAIIVPLRRGRHVVGTLKFYYRSPRNISETQKSIAEGFGQLLSTQLAAEALEEQTKLATSMELKALQAQINPHFLFNTINAISSFIRTDPTKARVLLREFAVFYRHTLENAQDLIPLSDELAQTQRYFDFELARFGEGRLQLVVDAPEELTNMLMPSFLVQPLVENAVHHGRPAEGKLTIVISARLEGCMLVVSVADDGVGMSEDAVNRILSPDSSTGLGIAVKNVNDRVEGYFGPGSHMEVESRLGEGTTVRMLMNVEERLRGLGMEISEK